MEIARNNLMDIMAMNFDGKDIHDVLVDCIVDAGINPREVDIKYAEQIPLSAPPICLGIINNDDELKNKLIIIDGNHRMHSFLNVHRVDRVKANIKSYGNRAEAIIDAYKFNVNHGRRLSDKEIVNGIKKITVLLRGDDNNKKKTYTELSKLLNMSLSSIYEYVAWDRVENVLGEKIDKLKATKIFFILKGDDGVNKVRKFWELNKNLSFRKIYEAAKFYKETGIITDYEQYKINSALLEEDDDEDGIESETVIKPMSLSNAVKQSVAVEEDFEETETEEEPVKKEETVGYEYEECSENIETGRPIEVIKTAPKKVVEVKPVEVVETAEEVTEVIEEGENNLVKVKGLVRKFSFETITGNIFNDLQEDILDANNILNETLQNYLHKNRDTFEKHKEEYLAIIRNCYSVLAKMEKTITKANKDYKD